MKKGAVSSRLLGRPEVATEFGTFLAETRIRLLEEIEKYGSITQAARRVPLSYKAAWEAVDAMNNLADQALVERSTGGRNGGGTRLTEHGRRIIALYRAVEREYQESLDRLATELDSGHSGDVQQFRRVLRRMSLRTSARNQFLCTVSGMREGDVDYEVFLRMEGGAELIAVITRESAEILGLAMGSEVFALVKASSLLILTDDAVHLSARNQLWGLVSRVLPGPVNALVTIDLGGGKNVSAVVTNESITALELAAGKRAAAVFKASSVILSVID